MTLPWDNPDHDVLGDLRRAAEHAYLRYDRDRGEVQTLMDGVVREAIEVRKGLEDQAVLVAVVEELRRRGFAVVSPTTREQGWTAMPLADPPDPRHPWVPSLQISAGLFDLGGIWFATEEECLDFIHSEILGAGEWSP